MVPGAAARPPAPAGLPGPADDHPPSSRARCYRPGQAPSPPGRSPMPVFTRPDAEIYYEVHGSGYPLLLFAPGGLRSELAFWRHSPSNPSASPPWMNPMADLSGRFAVIGMDQRNAGQSRGAVRPTDGWRTYAEDHLALMDHLGHARFHVMGGCI